MDYGRPIQFGYFVLPDSMRPMRPLELAVKADELGIDLIGAQDHPYQRRFYDVWTLLTAIALRTKRASVSPMSRTCPCDRPQCWPRPRPHSTCCLAAGSSSDSERAVSGRRSKRWAARCELP